MEHWFDSATKILARGDVARREILKSLALTGIASLFPETSWAQSLLGEAAKVQPTAAPAPCTRTSVGGKRSTTVLASASYKGQPLTLRAARRGLAGAPRRKHFFSAPSLMASCYMN